MKFMSLNRSFVFHYNQKKNTMLFSLKGSFILQLAHGQKRPVKDSCTDKHQKWMACTQRTLKQQAGEKLTAGVPL